MTYPVLPMALVTFLAGVSKERSELPKGPKHITTIIHRNQGVRAMRFAVENDAHWNEVVEKTIQSYNEADVDTVTFIYPTNGDEAIDYGIILQGGRKPFCFQWGYAPIFDIRLVHPDIEAQISKGVGVETMQGLLDRDVRRNKPGSAILSEKAAVNISYFAGMGDPKIAGSGGQ